MYESQITGEIGGFFYMLRNLIGRGINGRFLNLKWRRIVCKEHNGVSKLVYEPLAKAVLEFIKSNRIVQFALALAAIGDTIIWLSVLKII